jgi:glycosyltransferase involved in cell wall biosynthesis
MLIEIFLERLAYSFSKLILTVSKDEKSLLVNYGIKAEKIAIVPNGVDTLIFKPSSVNLTKNKTSTKFRIIFVGNMEYSPNQQAVQVISSIIAPDVCKKMRNVEFVIVGRVPSQLRFKHSNLKFVGVVDDVAKELEKSHIAIAPILKGSGTRLKILEYFSCGLPVISTKIGAEGLDVENGVHIIIEDDIENFADKIMLLLNNKNLARKIGKAARKLVVTKYDWQSIVKKLNKIYLSILAQRCLGKR